MPSINSANESEKLKKNQKIQENVESNKSDKYKDLLPKSISNVNDSITYTKKLIVTAISNIAYLRALFPENLFIDRTFEGLNLKIIKPSTPSFLDTQILSEWLIGAFEALDKKYLRCLSLSLYENSKEPENVLETYDFTISYIDNEANMTLDFQDARIAGEKAKLNALRLLRAIICVSQSLNDLPLKIFINMRLFYYDDVTPADYEPPGFKACDFEKYTYGDGRVKIDGGKVHSVWHQLTLNVNVAQSMLKEVDDFQTIDETFDSNSYPNFDIQDLDIDIMNKDNKNSSDSNENAIDLAMQNTYKNNKETKKKTVKHKLIDKVSDEKEKTKKDTKDSSFNEKNSNDKLDECIDSTINKINQLSVSKPNVSTNETNGTNSEVLKEAEAYSNESDKLPSLDTRIIQCGCSLNDQDGFYLLKCSICFKWQHAICYNMNFKDAASYNLWMKNSKHFCQSCCSLDHNLNPTDQTQLNLKSSQIYDLCLWRRLLFWCSNLKKPIINQAKIAEAFRLKKEISIQLIKKLESNSIIICINKKEKQYKIDLVKLQENIDANFRAMDTDTIYSNEIQNSNIVYNTDDPANSKSSNMKTSSNNKFEQTVPSTGSLSNKNENGKRNLIEEEKLQEDQNNQIVDLVEKNVETSDETEDIDKDSIDNYKKSNKSKSNKSNSLLTTSESELSNNENVNLPAKKKIKNSVAKRAIEQK